MKIKETGKKVGAVFGAVGIGLISFVGLVNLAKKNKIKLPRPKTLNEREEILRAQFGERLKCVHCKYCKRRLYSPFFPHPVKHWVPLYCKKFMFSLPPDVNLRCGAMLPEDAQREKV